MKNRKRKTVFITGAATRVGSGVAHGILDVGMNYEIKDKLGKKP